MTAKEHENKAFSLQMGKDFKSAIAEYTEAIKLEPNSGAYYGLRGQCYEGLEQSENALADYDKSISLNPKEGSTFFSRAQTYIALGEMEKAKADIEKAVELNSEKAGQYYFGFGSKIEKLTGDKREAAVYLKKSVEHGDYNDWAKEQLAEWGM
ncbi:MAG: hypothetical protein LBQ69_05355 [Treponema sp.]|jgi:tetratricopeptide (TPR) repeat protein|nr:hypothetical protein [Treponema sp.]